MAEDRATNLLKEEKAKNNKVTKQAKENQEQNALLQLRVTEIKEDKDKEVGEVRAQYNKIKEEIRSYERILPTHTFLTECGIVIGELPTYEDIFVNLKDKVAQNEQVVAKFNAFKVSSEESALSYQQNEELLK